MKTRILSLLVLVGVVGCGGGGVTSGDSAPVVHTGNVGSMNVAYVGTPSQPQLSFSTNGVTVTGMGGAAFTNLTYAPDTSNSPLEIVYDSFGEIWTLENGTNFEVTGMVNQNRYADSNWSHDGRIVFDRFDAATGSEGIYITNADGTGAHLITPGSGLNDIQPAWSPNNYKIAFINQSSGYTLFTMNTDGSSVKQLTSFSAERPCWSPDSSKICYASNNGGSGAKTLYAISANGGSPVPITSALSGYDLQDPAWSPDGTKIAFGSKAGGTYQEIYVVDAATGANLSQVTTGSPDYDWPSWTADSKHIVFQQNTVANTGSGTLWEASFDGAGLTQIPALAVAVDRPACAPIPGKRLFVAPSGGVLGNAASGFLVGQNGNSFASVMAFAATTPSTAKITPETNGTTGGSLIFLLSADSIKGLGYTNGYFSAPTYPIPGPTASSKEALVSFSGTNGAVSSVVLASKARPIQAVVKGGASLTYKGAFTSIWNGNGKNLAPNGATEVQLNPKTGQLVSFR